jgi:deferrochelatase/peroxidase EfeB
MQTNVTRPSNGCLPDADLAAIQGGILRGYRVKLAHHFVVSFENRQAAGRLLELMTVPASSVAVTTAKRWDTRPEFALNIGVTEPGLAALGMQENLLGVFPNAFRRGPAFRASALGDDGESAPNTWSFGGPSRRSVHAVLSLYAVRPKGGQDPDANGVQFGERCKSVRQLLEQHQVDVLHQVCAAALPWDREHFGFRDGISQPNVCGDGRDRVPDLQPVAPTGDFLLGRAYRNQLGGNFIGDLPRELADNGTYGAFRMMRQNVFAFREFTAGLKHAYADVDEELLAAKIVGRWRDGTPLMVAPKERTTDARSTPASALNEFDYRFSDFAPTYVDDFDGLRCPVTAHIRRMNPRSALVMGKPYSRRVIRRNVPYGPEALERESPDETDRGLVGFFFCGDLEMQFEFLLRTWANMDIHTVGVRDTKDPFLGAHPPSGGRFVIRTADERDPIVIQNMPRFVQTRGSVYCFMPAVNGLRFLASLGCST